MLQPDQSQLQNLCSLASSAGRHCPPQSRLIELSSQSPVPRCIPVQKPSLVSQSRETEAHRSQLAGYSHFLPVAFPSSGTPAGQATSFPAQRLPTSSGFAKGAVIGIVTCQDLGCQQPLGAGRAGAEPSFVSTLQPSCCLPSPSHGKGSQGPTPAQLQLPAHWSTVLSQGSPEGELHPGGCMGMPGLW